MKSEVIQSNIEARRDEIELYEINIATFTHIIDRIGDDDELAAWREELKQRLACEQREMRKAQMAMDALQAQA